MSDVSTMYCRKHNIVMVECPMCNSGSYDEGRKDERAAIVAWLRDSSESSFFAFNVYPSITVDGETCEHPVDIDVVAAAIEKGEHE